MRKNATRMLYGFAVVIAAMFIMLDEFGVINMSMGIWEFWPVLIIIAGLGAMITDKPNPWNISLLCAGVFFQLLQFGVVQSETARTVAFCMLAIAFGIWLIFGWIGRDKSKRNNNNVVNNQQFYPGQNDPSSYQGQVGNSGDYNRQRDERFQQK